MYVMTEDEMDAIQGLIDEWGFIAGVAGSGNPDIEVQITGRQLTSIAYRTEEVLERIAKAIAERRAPAQQLVTLAVQSGLVGWPQSTGLIALGSADLDSLKAWLKRADSQDLKLAAIDERGGWFGLSDEDPVTDVRCASAIVRKRTGNAANTLFVRPEVLTSVAAGKGVRQYLPAGQAAPASEEQLLTIFGVKRIEKADKMPRDLGGDCYPLGDYAAIAYVPANEATSGAVGATKGASDKEVDRLAAAHARQHKVSYAEAITAVCGSQSEPRLPRARQKPPSAKAKGG